jgi:hypothetical protein
VKCVEHETLTKQVWSAVVMILLLSNVMSRIEKLAHLEKLNIVGAPFLAGAPAGIVDFRIVTALPEPWNDTLFSDLQVSWLPRTNTPGGKNTTPPAADAAVMADEIAAASSVEESPTAPYVLTSNTCPALSLTVAVVEAASVGVGVNAIAEVGNGIGSDLVVGGLSEA